MTISGIGSSSYSIGQMSTMRTRAASGSTEQGAAKGKPNLAEIFTKLDADGSGGLDSTEVQSLTEKISEATGVSVDLSEFLATYDSDSDGVLSEDETVTALEANRPQGPPTMGGIMRGTGESEMVSAADTNGDGVISAEEAAGLVDIINNATGSELKAEDFISTYDENGDGSFSADEAVAAMEANRPQGPPPEEMGAMQGGGPDYTQMVTDADTDEDGNLSVTEAESLAGIISNATGSSTMAASDLIAGYDANGDGVLSEEETATALEANRPTGSPPPAENLTSTSEGLDSVFTEAIEKYLKMAALGAEGQAGDDLFSMLGGNSGSAGNIA